MAAQKWLWWTAAFEAVGVVVKELLSISGGMIAQSTLISVIL
jgi:hypothetical protein